VHGVEENVISIVDLTQIWTGDLLIQEGHLITTSLYLVYSFE
jgi:hypothetical protein